jgi:protocatechuate 3,4-dioxygenase beta subunit
MRFRLARWPMLVIVGLTLVVPAVSTAQCSATPPDMLGPFYKAGAPERGATGNGLTIHGVVRSTRECKPVPAAKVEWWSADGKGQYDDAHRAAQIADAEGRFRYVTDHPGRYPGRPPHVHVKVTAAGHKTLVTQIYPKPDQREIPFDFVLQPE